MISWVVWSLEEQICIRVVDIEQIILLVISRRVKGYCDLRVVPSKIARELLVNCGLRLDEAAVKCLLAAVVELPWQHEAQSLDGILRSESSGVDESVHHALLPNRAGSLIERPRWEVNDIEERSLILNDEEVTSSIRDLIHT